MDSKDIDKILQEIGGFRPPDAAPGDPTTGTKYGGLYGNGNPLSDDPITGADLGSTNKRPPDYQSFGLSQFDQWQRDIYQKLMVGSFSGNRPDLFVNVSPAGGKTAPMVEAWRQSFHKAYANPRQQDSILWITPTRQLANQIFYDDLRKQLITLIMNWAQWDNETADPTKPQFPFYLFPPDLRSFIATKSGKTAQTLNIPVGLYNSLRNTIENDLLYLSAHGQTAGTLGPHTVAAVCTYPYAPKIFEIMKPKIIVIDELQQYVPIYESGSSIDDKAVQFIDIMKVLKNNRDNSLILLTGSMSGNVAEQIRDFINSTFNRRLELIAQHVRNRAQISVLSHSKLRTPQDIISLVKRNVYDRTVGNALVLFSVKNTNPENAKKKAIMPLANQLIRQLPQRSIRSVTGCDPKLEDVEIHGDETEKYKRNPLPNQMPMKYRFPGPYDNTGNRPHPSGKLSLSQAANLIGKEFEDPQFMATYLQYMLSFEGKPVLKKGEPQPDPFLARCILCGFAYLAGGRDRDIAMDKRDIQLVQNLFKQGKIYFLLATDMIGVGTTLTVRSLYIPSLNKFISSETGMGPVDDSSLVQLINRVGRDPRIAAIIYCDPEDHARIIKLLNEDPSSAVEPAIFGEFSSSIEKVGNKLGFLKHRVILMFKLLASLQ